MAQIEAIKHLQEEADDEKAQQLTWVLEELESNRNPVSLTESELQDFVGTYGPRRIWLEGGALHYQRDDRPVYKLIPMAKDRFKLEGLGFFRIQFVRNDSGKVVELVGHYESGQQDRHRRSGD